MDIDWVRATPSIAAAFFASLVEFVEALTIVLAVGSARGWRSALGGSFAAVALLLAVTALSGHALTRIPLEIIQIIAGPLLLLIGLRWLRKAVLRAAGAIPLHDEARAFAAETERLRTLGGTTRGGWDAAGFTTSFQITLLEGVEVVVIVLGIATGGRGLLLPAALGALTALLMVIGLGFALHRPLAKVPENTLKFTVGVLLSSFGVFWVGEAIGVPWPGGDWSVPILTVGILAAAVIAVRLCRGRLNKRTDAMAARRQ
jgi:uncharacterized membrane protein